MPFAFNPCQPCCTGCSSVCCPNNLNPFPYLCANIYTQPGENNEHMIIGRMIKNSGQFTLNGGYFGVEGVWARNWKKSVKKTGQWTGNQCDIINNWCQEVSGGRLLFFECTPTTGNQYWPTGVFLGGRELYPYGCIYPCYNTYSGYQLVAIEHNQHDFSAILDPEPHCSPQRAFNLCSTSTMVVSGFPSSCDHPYFNEYGQEMDTSSHLKLYCPNSAGASGFVSTFTAGARAFPTCSEQDCWLDSTARYDFPPLPDDWGVWLDFGSGHSTITMSRAENV